MYKENKTLFKSNTHHVQALGVTGDCWTCQVMMNYSYFSLDCMLDYILTHDQADSGEWGVCQQQWFVQSYAVFYHTD